MPCIYLPFRKRPDPKDPSAGFPKAHKYDGPLQEGSQGCVEQWAHILTNTIIAVKVMAYTHPNSPEIQILSNLPPHNSIVRYLGHYEKVPSPTRVSILLEHCSIGDLYMLRSLSIDQNKPTFSEPFMWSAYTQLTSALTFLHHGISPQHPLGRHPWTPIVHRDLKFENILVKSLDPAPDWSSLDLKLADFGMAGYHNPAHPNPSGYIGTTHYWPPEVTWETKQFSPASNVWGIAAILHELAHNFPPIVDPTVVEAQWFAAHSEPPFPSTYSDSQKRNYLATKAPRRVIPINLDTSAKIPSLRDPKLGGEDKTALWFRRRRSSPKYSDRLNECVMKGLAEVEQRASAEVLFGLAEGGYKEILEEELKTQIMGRGGADGERR
ncbi:hypothetical protein COCSADRAFT_358262 [Bipolaris sorokiniana ND90Pr]|uniref:non-specific serine/threonine protein kinase n=1 Tax=Cochliobolus sativus (strain ND90Pr / ATCC 201652) TaxID=665912 RepID=M2T3Z1_COCSN|nr:uncharacterized protein COCSADRAFT_358262 [Bipolaris sorokiniana ND90Pr]EMD63732.1 hypothetical protein COCSADRAFT_358262 [Bipolaris sorokiniana ND90Pr]